MFKSKRSACSYNTQSYFCLKTHEPRFTWHSVAKAGSAKASSSTSSTAMNLQEAATKTKAMGVPRDVSVDWLVVLSELGFGKYPRERALQPSDGDMITDIARYLLDDAQGGGEKSLNTF